MPRPILLCTVGTSLLNPANAGGRHTRAGTTDWAAVGRDLAALAPTDRGCGAEVNSVASLVSAGHVSPGAGVFLLHSDTADGRGVAAALGDLFRGRGHAPAEAVPVPDLQDADPKRFRTRGLRNLAKLLAAKVREYGPAACAVNATGGYKAQIAVAVLMGQAVGVPVYYMHEKFAEVIAFPPLPVAFDFEVWMRASGLLAALEAGPHPRAALAGDWDERYESLVEGTPIDGVEYLELSAAGQIFHDTFRERFRTARDRVLPPPAAAKRPPKLTDHGVVNRLRAGLTRFLEEVTAAVPAVEGCETTYCNPDLPDATRFRAKGDGVEGVYSDGTATVKFRVDTTAGTAGQRDAVVAALNLWLSARG
jgi:putative CRISPR-associated protein (TIGR02619 family)